MTTISMLIALSSFLALTASVCSSQTMNSVKAKDKAGLLRAEFQATPLSAPQYPLYQHIKLVTQSFESTDSANRIYDTTCDCHPSVPLEILASSIISGVPAYWGFRAFFDDTSGFRPEAGLIPLSWLLYMVSLAPVASWTSGCEASAWHTLWIGLGSQLACALLYDAAYGHNHILNAYKINWPEYLALGIAPTIIASLAYNQFLHCASKNKVGSDQGMYIVPSVGVDKSLALNFGMRF